MVTFSLYPTAMYKKLEFSQTSNNLIVAAHSEPNFRELRYGEVHVQSPRTLALSPTTPLLCLYEFDALSLLRPAGDDGVYLQSQEHHQSRHVEPEHEDYHRPQLAVDLPVVTQLRDVVAQSAIS